MNAAHENYQKMLDLRNKGQRLDEIGRRFGVTRQTVCQIIGNTGELSAELRFWRKVDRRGPDDCWEWKAGRIRNGYGTLKVNGRHTLAHRISWEIHNGQIPEGMQVCHTCDNRGCCNPNHLFLGTAFDNMQDMAAKGRGWQPRKTGEKHGRSKLTAEQVKKIRELAQQGISQHKLAGDFGVTQGHISEIVSGKKWGAVA